MTWRQIVNSVLVEAGLLAMIASAVGIPLGLVITRALFDSIGEQSGIGPGLLDVVPGAPSLVALFSLAVLVAALGATLPAVRAARVNVADALRSE